MRKIYDIVGLPIRATDAYKNKFGRVLIIAGSVGMSGAAVLAGKAALRSGAGLVNIAVPDEVFIPVASAEPCYMVTPMVSTDFGMFDRLGIDDILTLATGADVVVFGPGVGVSEDVRFILERLIKVDGLKLVLDADGLNNLCRIYNWSDTINCELVLTPHPGEMKRLWSSVSRGSMPEERLVQVEEFLACVDCTLVLKGSETIVSKANSYYINGTGNPGMATGGSGDVLAGMVAAIWGQFAKADQVDAAFNAAMLAVNIHGRAGDIAAENFGEISMVASDIIEQLGSAFEASFNGN